MVQARATMTKGTKSKRLEDQRLTERMQAQLAKAFERTRSKNNATYRKIDDKSIVVGVEKVTKNVWDF